MPVPQPGRLVLLLGPASGGHRDRVELGVGRPGRPHLKLLAIGDEKRDAAAEGRMQVSRRRPKDVVGAGRAGKLAGIVVERPHDRDVLEHAFALVAHAPGQRAGQHGDSEENQEREQFLRLRDREGVDRLDEKEIVGDEREERGDHRGPRAEADAAEQDGGQEDHRQVGQPEHDTQPFADEDGAGYGRKRRQDLRVDPLGAELQREPSPRGRLRLLAGDDVNLDRTRLADELFGKRTPEQPPPESLARLPEDDLGHILAAGEAENFGRIVAALQPDRVAAEPLREREGLGDLVRRRGVRLLVDRLDGHRCPRGVEGGGELGGAPHHALGHFIGVDAGEQALRGGPGSLDRLLAQIVDHLVVDPVGRTAEREFAQRGQGAGGEEILDRAPRRLGHIDLALVQALNELVRRDVDEDDVGRLLKNAVGHRLAHDDAGDARDDVGEAFEMLDVERRPYVDAGVEQLLNVLPALGMAAFGRVGVSEFVDDDQLRLPLERRVDVELADGVAAVVDHAARQDLESLEESARLGAPVRFDEADDDVDALVLQPTRALQHRVGLTDAGGRADEHFQTANRIPPRCGQQRVRIGASVVGSGRLRHQLSSLATTLLADPAPSSAAKRWRGSLASAFTDVVTEDAGP